MRITASGDPRKLAIVRAGATIHIRVISGTILIASNQQDLIDGGGLQVSPSDNIVSLVWESRNLWVSGAGGVFEVILP